MPRRTLAAEQEPRVTTAPNRERHPGSAPPGQEACSGPADVLLIFPPLTEARFFPYLSLPYLTGHLRRQGRRVCQADLNIALLHDLLRRPELLGEAIRAQGAIGLAGWYRQAVAEVFTRHVGQINSHVMEKRAEGGLGSVRSVRLARHALELLVRDTFLVQTWRDLDQLDDGAQQAAAQQPVALGAAVECLYRGTEVLLTRHRPRVVGLSVAFFSQLGPALLMAAWVRRLAPGTRICLGGQQVMLRHEDLARLPGVRATVDALCWTSGEEPLERWLDALDGMLPLAAVPGMTWLPRSGAGYRSGQPPTLRFHDLGPPDFAGLPVRSYLNETMEVPIISCVGCYWGRCAFCSYGNRSLAPGTYQQGTVTQIADAVEAVVRGTGAEFIAIVDENTNLRLILRAMREVRDRGVRVRFGVRSRLESSLADPVFCRSLAEVGCSLISAGYEGNSQRLLDLMDRGVRAAEYQRIVDNIAAAGIVLRLSVMGHVFDETPDEFDASVKFLIENERKFGIDALELMVPEPGSRLAASPEAFGISLDRSGTLEGNFELSYLAGRVGYPMTVDGGPARAEALDRLLRVFRSVTPGMAGSARPSRSGSSPRATGAVKPYPWVQTVPPEVDSGDSRITVADLVWEQFYVLPRGDVRQRADGLLAARSERGRRLLGHLVEVAAGTPQPGDRADADLEHARSPA